MDSRRVTKPEAKPQQSTLRQSTVATKRLFMRGWDPVIKIIRRLLLKRIDKVL